MRKKYIIGLFSFMVLILGTLIWKYPSYRFQLYKMSMLEDYAFETTTKEVTLSHYYSGPTKASGGASVSYKSDEPQLKAVVLFDDGKKLNHQLEKQADGSYLMDVLEKHKSASDPKKIQLYNLKDEMLWEAPLTPTSDTLYEASSQSYVLTDTYINAAGVFMGSFSCIDRDEIKKNYSQVTIEFCYPDATKTSGYELVARKQVDTATLLSERFLGFVPFLPNGSYKKNQPIHVIFAFEGKNQKTIVLALEEVDYGH